MKKYLMFVIMVSAFLMFMEPSNSLAIGQMTEPIVYENAKQGETFEEMLYIFNTEKIENTFKITTENDIADWVKFYDPEQPEKAIDEITIAEISRYNVLARFEIPKGTPNGEYKGVVSVETLSKDKDLEEKVMTSVGQKIDREVMITVIDIEEINLKTSIIPKSYNLKSSEPLSIRIIYDNLSNISIRPQIQLKVSQDEKIVHNAIYPFPEDVESVPSFTIREVTPLEFQTTGLEDGKYLAEMNIIVDEDHNYKEKFSFNIGNVEIFKDNGIFGALSGANGLVMKIFIFVLFLYIALSTVTKIYKTT